MNGLDSAKCQKSRRGDINGIYGKFNEIRQKPNSVIFSKEAKIGSGRVVGCWIHFWREKELLLSRFAANRTVGSRRSKKQSRSTRRGLRVDTDLVEFRQLQEVEIFSYLVYFLAKSHVYG